MKSNSLEFFVTLGAKGDDYFYADCQEHGLTSIGFGKTEHEAVEDFLALNFMLPTETVNHPAHYASPSGVECIDIAEHMSFNLGNALKYIWRAGSKGPTIEDLKKSIWYLDREISRLSK